MYSIINELFNDMGVALDTPYFTAKQVILILAFVFACEVMIRLITAITDLCRKQGL